MRQKKTLIAARAGVRLERIEDLAERQRGKITYRLSTYRPPQPRFIADKDEAEDAFAREVSASLQDPVIVGLMERGAI
jgi:hypothetical protein